MEIENVVLENQNIARGDCVTSKPCSSGFYYQCNSQNVDLTLLSILSVDQLSIIFCYSITMTKV